MFWLPPVAYLLEGRRVGFVDYCDPDPRAEWEVHRLPNYGSDLNAIQHVVKSKINEPGFCGKYNCHLACACHVSGRDVRTKREDFIILNAPADKRREAFLRTIGKWVES